MSPVEKFFEPKIDDMKIITSMHVGVKSYHYFHNDICLFIYYDTIETIDVDDKNVFHEIQKGYPMNIPYAIIVKDILDYIKEKYDINRGAFCIGMSNLNRDK